jgi:hypothetical protein
MLNWPRLLDLDGFCAGLSLPQLRLQCITFAFDFGIEESGCSCCDANLEGLVRGPFGGAASGLLDTCCRSLSSMLLPSIEKAVSVWTDGRMGKEKGRCYASGT